VQSIARRNVQSIALPESGFELQDRERSITRHVRSNAVTENAIDGAGLQNQYGKNLRTTNKFLRILIIILQGFAHDHTTHSQINSRITS
jgi:hypothetical protein